MTTIRLAISTCPNDTFAFHGLIHRLVDWRGLDFQIKLLDIQELNRGIDQGDFDVAKASFHAALRWSDKMVVMPSGSALGFGVGPLLLSSRADLLPNSSQQLTVCPGQDTTAALLFQIFYPETTRIEHRIFSEIMPTLQRQEADFGVCIHEGRFTWQQAGLSLVEDLGTRWEKWTGLPLPLGGILAERSLGNDVLGRVQSVIQDSLELSLRSPEAALPTMRQHAQEMDDRVLMQHVELYVNQWTVDLGHDGQQALLELTRLAKRTGLLSEAATPLRVWSGYQDNS